MRPQSPAHHQILIHPAEMPRVIARKKPGLGRNHAADAWNPDNSPVQMAGHRQIRAPAGVGVKMHRIMSQQNAVPLRIRPAKDLLQLLLPEIGPAKLLIIKFLQLKAIDIHRKAGSLERRLFILQKDYAHLT